MPIDIVAATAVALITQFFTKTAESTGEKFGEKIIDKLSSVFQAVKKKFTGDAQAEKALSVVEAAPDSSKAATALTALLQEKINSDTSFKQTLEKLIEEVRAADTGNVLAQATGVRNVAVGGSNFGNINTGHNSK